MIPLSSIFIMQFDAFAENIWQAAYLHSHLEDLQKWQTADCTMAQRS